MLKKNEVDYLVLLTNGHPTGSTFLISNAFDEIVDELNQDFFPQNLKKLFLEVDTIIP